MPDLPNVLPTNLDPCAEDRPPPIRDNSGRQRRRQTQLAVVLAIGCGGSGGAFAHYAVTLWLPTEAGAFPRGTFAINVTGAGLLGFLLVLVTEHFPRSRIARLVLGTGFIGAFTTFSTFAVEADLLLRGEDSAMAARYVVSSLAAGLTAVFAGIGAGRVVLRGECPLQEEEV
jgi:CrcB protein